MQERTMQTSEEAFRELDHLVDKPKALVPISQVKPVDLQLVDVDNKEYKAKRDEALQKPGAVVGHATLQ
jgi:hypothetical protein